MPKAMRVAVLLSSMLAILPFLAVVHRYVSEGLDVDACLDGSGSFDYSR